MAGLKMAAAATSESLADSVLAPVAHHGARHALLRVAEEIGEQARRDVARDHVNAQRIGRGRVVVERDPLDALRVLLAVALLVTGKAAQRARRVVQHVVLTL